MARFGNPEELTPQQLAFLEHAKKPAITLTEAARLAGYADPTGEVDRLLKNPKLFALLHQHLRPKMMKLAKLKLPPKAQKGANEILGIPEKDFGDLVECRNSILGINGGNDLIGYEKQEVSVAERLAEGVPLLICLERDLATLTADEIRARWTGANLEEAEKALGVTLESLLVNHNPLYYLAERMFFSNKTAKGNPKFLYAPYHRDRYCKPVMEYILGIGEFALRKYNGIVWLGPRDTYKSVFNHGVTPTWFAFRNKWLYDYDVRIVLRHHKEELAASNMQRIKDNLMHNAWARRVFAPFCPPDDVKDWGKSTAFSLANADWGGQAEDTWRALGVKASDTGYHSDLDLGDDLVTEDHGKSSKIREEARHKYRSKRYTIDPTGKEVNTGTRYHAHDLWSIMIDSKVGQRELYKVISIKAIEDDCPDCHHQHLDEETGNTTICKCSCESKKILAHPFKLTGEYLSDRRQEEISRDGNDLYWHLQYQNNVRTSGLLIADKSWIREIRQSDVDPRSWRVILVDPAWKGTKNAGKGCAASIQVWAVERRGSILLYTLLDGVHSRELTSKDGEKEIFRLMEKYGTMDVGVEESGGYTFRTALEAEATSRGMVINLIEFASKQTAKHMRMTTFLKAMQAGRVFVAKECNEELREAWEGQVLDFPQLDEDDDDALDCAGYTQDSEVAESYAPAFNSTMARRGQAPQAEVARRTRHCGS
jgi:hypothetical protein